MVHPEIAHIIGWFSGCVISMCLIIIVLILVPNPPYSVSLQQNHYSYTAFNQTLGTFVFRSSLHT